MGMLALKRQIIENWEDDQGTYISHTLREEKVYKHALVYGHRALTDEYEEFCRRREKEKF
jgi:hypothetical protein